MSAVRGIRGATIATANTDRAILGATRELLTKLVADNDLRLEDIASAWFTTTPDLNATFPATAARQLGWLDVALMCSHEMSVPGKLPRVIRVLLQVNSELPQRDMRWAYLRGADALREDTPPIEADSD